MSDLNTIPRERLAGALGMLLLEGFANHPDALLSLVVGGEDAFVTRGKATDRFGLTTREYRSIYRKLRARAVRLGLPVRAQ